MQECGVSEVLELYGYKEGALMERVRIAEAGQRSAEREARHLHHALASSSSQLLSSHHALHSAHRSLQAKTTQLSALTARLESVQTQADETHNKYAQVTFFTSLLLFKHLLFFDICFFFLQTAMTGNNRLGFTEKHNEYKLKIFRTIKASPGEYRLVLIEQVYQVYCVVY
jgi:hypothetical protein